MYYGRGHFDSFGTENAVQAWFCRGTGRFVTLRPADQSSRPEVSPAVGQADRAMPHRKPEPGQSRAASPFLWIETARGNVEVWALGGDSFRITAPGQEQIVTGYDQAERTADALAERLR
jgi:hypothetical protein